MPAKKTHPLGLAILTLTTLLALLLTAAPPGAASSCWAAPWASQAEVRFTLGDEGSTLGAGLRVNDGNLWVTGSLDRLGVDEGPTVSLSALYHIPRNFLFFNPYGGLGVHTATDGSLEPHVTGGGHFWFLYWETEYPLVRGGSPFHRSGIRLDF